MVIFKHKFSGHIKTKTFLFIYQQNRRAKWRKREPPRKNGYVGPNSQSGNLGATLGPPFATFSQNSTVSPPGSVDSWTSYQPPYELSSHFNLLSPTAPYGTFSGQYSPYVHESQLFPVRQHFEYGSPPRGGGNGDIDEKNEHYATIDEKFDNHCSDGLVSQTQFNSMLPPRVCVTVSH